MNIKSLLSAFILLQSMLLSAQKLENNRDKIQKAKSELNAPLSAYFKNTLTFDLDTLLNNLISSKEYDSKNEFQNYIIGGALYVIDADKSFEFHEKAYQARPTDVNFILEYAIELHRKQKFEHAANLYEQYLKGNSEDKRINALLSDCYMNLGATNKAIDKWKQAEHERNHTGIDFAIHSVYGRTDQMKLRNNIRKEINQGNFSRMDDLIFMDMNWEKDWYNSLRQEYLLNADISLIQTKLGDTNKDFQVLKALSSITEKQSKDDIEQILKANNILMDKGSIPKYGKTTSNVLKVCFAKGVLNEKPFYAQKGNELLKQANETKNIELLNIYAYLQATVEGKVKEEIDKLGWQEFKDERFAISYLTGQDSKKRCSNSDIDCAVKDFPNSSGIYWHKVDCVKTNGGKLKPLLVELIKKEFKTLQTDPSRYSYRLKTYFAFLEQEE